MQIVRRTRVSKLSAKGQKNGHVASQQLATISIQPVRDTDRSKSGPDFREVVSFIMPRTTALIVVIGFVTVCIASSAGAQENLERAKTAAQLYATNCASCHKSPQS